MARQNFNAPAAVCAIARAGSGILYVSVCISQSAGTTLVAQASQSTANQTCESPNPTRCYHSLLLIGLLARLSGFDSQWRTPVTQDPGSRGALLPCTHTPTAAGKVTPASGCAHDGAQFGQPCRFLGSLELASSADMKLYGGGSCALLRWTESMAAFRGGHACMHACRLPGCHLRRTTAQGPHSHMGVRVSGRLPQDRRIEGV